MMIGNHAAAENWPRPTAPQIHGNGPPLDTWTYRSGPTAVGMQPMAVIASQNREAHTKHESDRESDPADLRIIYSPGYNDWGVFLSFGFEQLDCPDPGCRILVQFDDAPSEELPFTHISPRTNIGILAVHSPELAQRIAASKSLKLNLPVHDEGEKTFDFDIDGLDLAKLQAMTLPDSRR